MKNSTSTYFSELAKLRWGQRETPPTANSDLRGKLKKVGQAGGKEGGKTFSVARHQAFKKGNEMRWRIHRHYQGKE